MVDGSDDHEAAIKRAGAPSSPNGAKISSRVREGFKASRKSFADAQAQAAKHLDHEHGRVQGQGRRQLGVDHQEHGDRISKNFGSLDKLDTGKKLEAAVKAAPECAFLT